jgi:hypothetical protein
LQRRQRPGCRRHGGAQRQIGAEDTAQFLGTGVDVHQLLHRARRLQQGVAAGRHLAQARTDGDQQIRLLDALGQRRVDGNAHIAGVQRVVVVKVS